MKELNCKLHDQRLNQLDENIKEIKSLTKSTNIKLDTLLVDYAETKTKTHTMWRATKWVLVAVAGIALAAVGLACIL